MRYRGGTATLPKMKQRYYRCNGCITTLSGMVVLPTMQLPIVLMARMAEPEALMLQTPVELMKCPSDSHAHPPAHKVCEPNCRKHRMHIYIICYGKPVMVRDRDYLRQDWETRYPITHYVGFTTQLPIDRVRQHAALSAHYLVEVRPGTEFDEQTAKLYEKCPRCSRSLWYCAESPSYKRKYRRQVKRLRRQR